MSEMALSQIGRKPLNDKNLERDGYCLAAGIALGLINLGKGTFDPCIKDLNLEERLIRFIEGGKIIKPPFGILSNNHDQKCSSIREGNRVNTHITAPSAIMALSMIALMSNNQQLADRITIPNSF